MKVYHRKGQLNDSVQSSSDGWDTLLDYNDGVTLSNSSPSSVGDFKAIKCEPNSIHSFYIHRMNSSGVYVLYK